MNEHDAAVQAYQRWYEDRYGQPLPEHWSQYFDFAKDCLALMPCMEAEDFVSFQDALAKSGVRVGGQPISVERYISIFCQTKNDSHMRPTLAEEDRAKLFYSLPDLPPRPDVLYPSRNHYPEHRFLRDLSGVMSANPSYILSFYENGDLIPPYILFQRMLGPTVHMKENKKANAKNPWYGSFWMSLKKFLRLAYGEGIQVPDFVDVKSSQEFLRSWNTKDWSHEGVKTVLSLGGKKVYSADLLSQLTYIEFKRDPKPEPIDAVQAQVMLMESFHGLCDVPVDERCIHPLRSIFFDKEPGQVSPWI